MLLKTTKLITSADSKSLVKWKLTTNEKIWRSLFVCVVIGGSFLVEKIIRFQTSEEINHIQKGQLTDFWISCVVACLIALIRYCIKYSLQQYVIPLLSDKRLKTAADGKKRAEQICKWIFDWFYYTGTTLAAFQILKGQKFFPWFLGGPEDGDCNLLFMGFPEVPDIPYLRIFYLIQLGTHLFTFIHHLFWKYNDPKYFEYVLHHGLALFLIIFSYLMNMILVGTVVLFLHDISDVTLISARIYTDYKYRNKTINIFLGIVAVVNWIFLRNIVFQTCVIRSCFNFYMSSKNEMLAKIVQGPIAYQTAMLSALAIMHIYWIIFMIKGAFNLLRVKDKNGYDS